MDFRQIRYFVSIAELGSLSKAAEQLLVAQPSLTQSIKGIEEELGVALFNRSRQGMELTDAGTILLESAYKILNQYNQAKENISSIDLNPEGKVSIGMTASALHVLSVPIANFLSNKYPKIELNIEEGLAGNIQQGLELGQYDLIVSLLGKSHEGISVETLLEEELYFVSKFEKSADKSDIQFDELRNYKLVLPEDTYGPGGAIEIMLKDHNNNINRTNIRGALTLALLLVESGYGHGIASWAAIDKQVQQEKLSVRRIVSPTINQVVCLMYSSSKPLSRATLAVRNALKESIIETNKKGNWPGKLLL